MIIQFWNKEALMNLQQLRSACEVARRDLNLSRTARYLNSSQPAVTRQLQLLEQELGVPLFLRSGKRLAGLTPAGRALLPVASRVLESVEDMRRIARAIASGAEGELTLATVHTHARYVLPAAIERFVRERPSVRLRLRQGSRVQVASWVAAGEADFSLATLPREPFEEIEFYPCYDVHRIVLARPDHPLARVRRHTIEDIARHPLITYDRDFEAHGEIMDVFEDRGLRPNIVLSAIDADIMKAYVRSGLGVGIVAHLAHDPAQDGDLVAIDARHLFPSATAHVGLRRGSAPGAHVLHLIGLFAPKVRDALEGQTSRERAPLEPLARIAGRKAVRRLRRQTL
jgi:LysR family cys regulon transcriptional activator